MLLRKSNKEKAPKEKPVKAAKEKPAKPVKEKAAKAPKTPKAPKAVKPRPPKIAYKSDVFTLMLLISFLALVTACIFLYLNVTFDAQNM